MDWTETLVSSAKWALLALLVFAFIGDGRQFGIFLEQGALSPAQEALLVFRLAMLAVVATALVSYALCIPKSGWSAAAVSVLWAGCVLAWLVDWLVSDAIGIERTVPWAQATGSALAAVGWFAGPGRK